MTYEDEFNTRLIAMIDQIFPDSIAMFEELIFDADPGQDLHLVLASPGGDGETAVRLVRSAQARCRQLSVIVPDQAKSAATLLAMGAHHILMGPTSDLGPVDPQFRMAKGELVSAKGIIAAVDDAEQRVQAKPETFPLHASLLSDVTSIMVQQAREELARTDELLLEALRSCPDRDADTVQELAAKLHDPLVEEKSSHGAIFSAEDAAELGLPVVQVDPSSRQWQLLWRLYTKYLALGPRHIIYEGRKASQVHAVPYPPMPFSG
jgi:ClpP class serine protease